MGINNEHIIYKATPLWAAGIEILSLLLAGFVLDTSKRAHCGMAALAWAAWASEKWLGVENSCRAARVTAAERRMAQMRSRRSSFNNSLLLLETPDLGSGPASEQAGCGWKGARRDQGEHHGPHFSIPRDWEFNCDPARDCSPPNPI